MMIDQARVYAAIVESVYAAIEHVGVEGVKAMSWFQSSAKNATNTVPELEAA